MVYGGGNSSGRGSIGVSNLSNNRNNFRSRSRVTTTSTSSPNVVENLTDLDVFQSYSKKFVEPGLTEGVSQLETNFLPKCEIRKISIQNLFSDATGERRNPIKIMLNLAYFLNSELSNLQTRIVFYNNLESLLNENNDFISESIISPNKFSGLVELQTKNIVKEDYEFLGVVIQNQIVNPQRKVDNVVLSSQKKYFMIFEAGQTSGRESQYTFFNDSVWDGPVHQMDNGGFMTGDVHSANSAGVARNFVNSQLKIEDYRIEQQILDLGFDFRVADTDLYPFLEKSNNVNHELVKLEKKPSNFSDLFISRSSHNHCKFFFSINWREILIRNSVFGKLFLVSSERDSLLSACKINSLKIKRNKIDLSKKNINKKIFSPILKNKKSNINESFNLVVQTGDDEFGVILPVSSGKKNKNSFEEVVLNVENTGVRHFSGTDAEISHRNDGVYSYSVEMEILDFTSDLVLEKIGILKKIIKSAEAYSNLPGLKPSNLDYDNTKKTRRVADNETFFNISPGSIQNIVNPYIQTVEFFNGSFDGTTRQKIKNTLNSFLLPNYANLETVSYAIGLMKKTLRKITDMYEIDSKLTSPSFKNKKQFFKISPKGRNKSILIKYDFEKTFDNQLPMKTGFDFLGTSDNENKDLGLYRTSFARISSNYDEQTKIFFGNSPKTALGVNEQNERSEDDVGLPNINMDEPKNVYFSPKDIILPDESVENGSLKLDRYLKVFANSVSNTNTAVQSNKVEISKVFANKLGVSVVTDNESNNPNESSNISDLIVNVSERDDSKIINKSFSSLFGIMKSAFIADQMSFEVSTDILEKKMQTYDISNSGSLIFTNIEQMKTSQEKNNFLNDAPTQIKRLIFNDDLQNNDDLPKKVNSVLDDLSAPENYCYFFYKLQTVNKFEILIGYEEVNGRSNLRKPIWRSNEGGENITNLSPLLFCKMSPFESKKYGITRNKTFDLPTYNEYFFVDA